MVVKRRIVDTITKDALAVWWGRRKMQHSFTPFHIHKNTTGPMNAAAASSLVNGGGGLNMRKLQQELALDEDQRLTRVDAVKKRAVRTAGSYEEFKNLVACAHLRPLSRKDIHSVAQRTQVWTTTSSSAGGMINFERKGRKGGDSNILCGQQDAQVRKTNAAKTKNGIYNSSPSFSSSTTATVTTSLTFEREWQQLAKAGKTNREKLLLLYSAGGASFLRRCYVMGKKKREMNADVLGDLVVALREGLPEEEDGERRSREKKEYGDHGGEEDKICAALTTEALEILHVLTQIDRVQITFALLDRSQREAMSEILGRLESEDKVEGEERRQRMKEVQRAFTFLADGGGRKLEEAD